MKSLLALLVLSASSLYAQLTFDSLVQEVTLKPDDSTVVVTFPFTAQSDVELLKFHSYCGCLKAAPKHSRSWSSGETGQITLHLDANTLKSSSQKSIALHFRDHPVQKLSVKADIPKGYSISPATHSWKIGAPLAPKTFKISFAHEFNIKISSLKASSPHYSFTLKELPAPQDSISPPRQYEFTVTPKATDKRSLCMFRFQTDSEYKRFQNFNLLVITQ